MIGRSLATFAVVLGLAAAAACGGTKPQVATTGSASAAGVARFKSYVMEIAETPPQGYSPAKRSKVVLEMARPKIEAELTKKGYVAASSEAEADLVVRVAAGVKTIVDQPTGAAQIAGADADADEVSTLAINILDRKTKESLFAGSAKKEIHSRTVKDADVTTAVTGILEPVPASAAN